MRALIVGAHGQLGRALVATAPADVTLVAHGRDTLDLTDAAAVRAAVALARPDIIVNAAAYTSVDRAEAEEARAFAVNAVAVGVLAQAARAAGARLVHVSTDFVFDGASGAPYPPDAAPNPLNAYGRSKRAGELAAGDDALVVRTAWLHAPRARNFALNMVRLMAEREEVRVVADQIGTPTYAPHLAAGLWRLAVAGAHGLHHFTDSGVASWYDFAVAVQEEGIAAGVLDRAVPIIPIATAAHPTAARRPACAVLDTTRSMAMLGGPAPHWRVGVRATIGALGRG